MNCKLYFIAALSLLGLVSCSEDSGEDFDINEWKTENETYFEAQYQSHLAMTGKSFILPNWSMPSSVDVKSLPHTSCILVDVLEEGVGEESPLFTDSVEIHYSGRLIPSEYYPEGYEFDRSWLTIFDPEVDPPAKFAVTNVVEGFSTALQHMHRGDRWRVTVPYQLGYGSSSSNATIPAYSVLVFQIYLSDFWQLERGDRD